MGKPNHNPKILTNNITIPNNWNARPYQLEALQAFYAGKKRQNHIWHRRAGKDSFSLNLTAMEVFRTVGSYWHLFPLQTQARKAIWNGVDSHTGRRFIDQAFPPQLRSRTLENDMMIEFRNGSTWQMTGSDKYDALVGSAPRGVVFSEWALCDPAAWDYIRPIIAENDGWAIFITTYRGKNHAYKMYQETKNDPKWFTSLKTVDDTGVLSKEILDQEEKEMDKPLFLQEYYCSPMAAFRGAYFGKEMMKMHGEKRIKSIGYENERPVYASFDLGMNDMTTAIFIQEKGNEVKIIGSRNWRMTDISDIVHDIRKSFPWGKQIDTYVLPWDGGVKTLQTGKPLSQTIEEMGEAIYVVPKTSDKIADINLARQFLKRTSIDNDVRAFTDGEPNNERLIEALEGYRTEETKRDPDVFQLSPLHSWESHPADAWRTFCKYRHLEGDALAGWGEAPSYKQQDKGII